jgi:hypothetical protein
VVHHVEGRQGARSHLAVRVCLAEPQQPRQIGRDPEHEKRNDPEAKVIGLPICVERDRETGNDPEVAESRPVPPLDERPCGLRGGGAVGTTAPYPRCFETG